MILTYKVKHNRDFSRELGLAKKVAEYAIANRSKLSSKYVAHIGLKAVIANQILRKYGRNKKAKTVHSVNLIIPNQGIKYKDGIVTISSLKLELVLDKQFEKINQIEINREYAFISVTVPEAPQYKPETNIGLDLNTTGHCAVAAIKETGKVFKLGKDAQHVHTKYSNIRRYLQKRGLYSVLKAIKNRESRIVRDINHKVSRFIVDLAIENKGGIHLENLKGIRKNKKHGKGFRYSLNSWSFSQLRQFIEYKALLAGVPVIYEVPAYTSKVCSRCGLIGERKGKEFKCPSGHVEHADSNAAFNLALLSQSIVQLQAERVVCKRSTDTRQEATFK
jgi:putative transposase